MAITEEVFICSYNGGKKLKIEAKVEKGVGFRPAQDNFKDGEFLLDATFSPVVFVILRLKMLVLVDVRILISLSLILKQMVM